VRAPRQGVTRADADALPAAGVADAVEDDYRRDATVALSAVRPPGASEPAATPEEPPPKDDAAGPATADVPPRRTAPLPGAAKQPGRRRRRRRKLPGAMLVGLVLLAMILAGAWVATRAVYFVGTDPRDDRTIAIFRGLPYDLPFGIELYERFAGSGVTIDEVPRARRSTFTNHKLRSRDDAENLVIALERGQIE
jgi:protein phosphatase